MSTSRNTATIPQPAAGPVAPSEAPATGTAILPTTGTAPVPPTDLQGTQTYDPASRQEAGTAQGGEPRKPAVERRAVVDRRLLDLGSPTGLERRRGPGRRREEDRRSAEEGEMTDEQFEFVLAVDTYKRLNNRPFPTWTEVLEVVKQLGYRKVAASELTLSRAVGRSSTQIPNPERSPAAPKAPDSDYLPG